MIINYLRDNFFQVLATSLYLVVLWAAIILIAKSACGA